MLRREVMGQRKLAKHICLTALLATAMFAMPARAASFDCDKATAPDEKAICADRALNDQDVRMAVFLEALGALQLMGANGAMRDEQREWLKMRGSCGADRQSLTQLYKSRVDMLRSNYLTLAHQKLS